MPNHGLAYSLVKKKYILWLIAVVAILLILYFAVNNWIFADNRRPQVPGKYKNLAVKSEYEKELQQINVLIQGHDGKLVEAIRENDLWNISIEFDDRPINKPSNLFKQASSVFAGLINTNMDFAIIDVKFRTEDLKDVFGRALKNEPIIHIALFQKTIEKIDWAGFEEKDFPIVADVFWMHEKLWEALAKELAAKEESSSQQSGKSQQNGSSQGQQSSSF